MSEDKYKPEYEFDKEAAEEDYRRTAGGNVPTIPGDSTPPTSIHFGEILWWIFIRLVPASILLYVIIRMFNLLFPI